MRELTKVKNHWPTMQAVGAIVLVRLPRHASEGPRRLLASHPPVKSPEICWGEELEGAQHVEAVLSNAITVRYIECKPLAGIASDGHHVTSRPTAQALSLGNA